MVEFSDKVTGLAGKIGRAKMDSLASTEESVNSIYKTKRQRMFHSSSVNQKDLYSLNCQKLVVNGMFGGYYFLPPDKLLPYTEGSSCIVNSAVAYTDRITNELDDINRLTYIILPYYAGALLYEAYDANAGSIPADVYKRLVNVSSDLL